MEHYFIDKPHSSEDYFSFNAKVLDEELVFNSCQDIFSKNCVDYGSKVLIETVYKKENLFGNVLDIGCGYGAIGIVLAKKFPSATFLLSDINATAVKLSKENIVLNRVKNAKAILSTGYEKIDQKFNFVITNPPIKAGKENLFSILLGAREVLLENGKLILVIKKKHGEESVKKMLEQNFKSVEVLKRDSGYYILKAEK